MKRRRPVEHKAVEAPTFMSLPAADRPLLRKAAPYLLAGFLFVLYFLTLLPGVDAGDSAELQFLSPLLGICHPPGYAIEICFGKLFSLLPVGGSIAWRINLMMAVFGTVGCLALYGVVRRVSGSVLAGVVAASILGLSNMYWSYCLVAEVYVFYTAFLLSGMYGLCRFIETNRAVWLYAGMLALGVCVADRISEIVIMPGFLILWFSLRKKVRMGVVRVVLAMVVFVIPFTITVAFNVIRYSPENRISQLYGRDTNLRFQILADNFTINPQPLGSRIEGSVKYCTGLLYKAEAKFNPQVVGRDFDKYAWMLSGLGAKGDRYAQGDPRNNEQGRGTSIGLLGLLLIPIGLVLQRRNWGWAVLGLWMFASNLAFILWHHRWDNLTFTIPGIAGLALAAGLGAAGGQGVSRRMVVYRTACLLVPLYLLATNYNLVNRNTPEEKVRQAECRRIAEAKYPQKAVVVSTFWPAMTYRYLIHIEGGRSDVHVIHENTDKWQKLIEYFQKNGQPVYLHQSAVNPGVLSAARQMTEPDIAAAGFVKLPAVR